MDGVGMSEKLESLYGKKYDYHGNVYEVTAHLNGYIWMQDVSCDYSFKIKINKFFDELKKGEITEMREVE